MTSPHSSNGECALDNRKPGATATLKSMTIDDGIGAHDCFAAPMLPPRCLDAFIPEPA